jgi:dihydroorotate dehydrogenase (NAD+) catalytic subunit
VAVAAAFDLSVDVGTVRLANPVIAAGGTFGYGVEFSQHVNLSRLGGVVTKGLSLEPMQGAPPPRLAVTPGGMLNAVGLQNIGVRAFVAEKLPQLRGYRTQIIANVFGHTVEEYVRVIEVLEQAEGLAAYELNISCPNTARGGAQFGTDPALAAEVVAAARKASRRPLWVKLSPNVTDIVAISRAAESAGADALTVANTYPAMSVDPRTGLSRLGNPTGGLSGPAIRPITLRLVHEVFQKVRIPVIGLGGIETPEDVAEYIVVGASAVQIGTTSFADPRATELILEGFESWCVENNIHSLKELKGRFRANPV